jgi:O-antigen/teichoic acid export membrane protein
MKIESLKLKLQYVLNHQGIRRYSVNTLWLFAEQILRMIVGFLVGVWVARYLGPEKFGLFSYALAFVSIFQGIANLGLDRIVVRDLVREPEKREIYLGSSFWLKFIGGLLTFFIILVVSYFTSDTFQTFLFINIIAAGIIFQSFEVIDFYYQATVQAKYISLRKMIQLILSSIIKIMLVLIKAELIWFVLVTLFDAVSLAIFSWFIYKAQGLPNFLKYFNLDVGKRLLKESWPLVLSSIAILIQARIDQVMLKEFIGVKEVGYYNAALRIVEVFGFIPMVLNNSLFPAIVQAKKISKKIYYERLLNYYRLLFLLFIIVSIPIFIFGREIILLLYGQDYEPSGILLSLLAFRLFLTNFGVGKGFFVTIEGLFKYSLFLSITGGCMNLILNWFFIPQFKSIGAIISSYVSFAFTIFLLDFLHHKARYNFKIMTKAVLTFYKLQFSIK